MINGRSKADFRARREMIGLTQGDIADDLGVTQMSVNRWEREGFNDPPEVAWSVLEHYEAEQKRVVRELAEEHPGGSKIGITIFRTKEEYKAVQAMSDDPATGSFNFANANAFAVARTLDALGVEVVFRYPCVE